MALIVKGRVFETTTTTGTGAFALNAAITGYRRFSSVMSTSDVCYYMAEAVDANGNPSGDWETGLGTYSSANTLTRTTVHESSNSNNAVNFGVGTKRVALDTTAEQIAKFTGAGLTDPNADRILFWDDSAGAVQHLSMGTNLSISGTTLNATGGIAANRAFTSTLVNTTASSNIPFDTSIPQITEGTEAFSLNITPSSTTARIRVEAHLQWRVSTGSWCAITLFVNGGSNAVATNAQYTPTAGGGGTNRLVYEYVPGSTSQQTLSLRFGPDAGAALTLNSIGTTSFGGTLASSLAAFEVA